MRINLTKRMIFGLLGAVILMPSLSLAVGNETWLVSDGGQKFYHSSIPGDEKPSHFILKAKGPIDIPQIHTMGGGYQFNNYFGLEGGYTRLPSASTYGGPITKDNSLIDIAGKGIIPLDSGFNIFGVLGAARVGSQFAAGTFSTNNTNNEIPGLHSQILPYLGAGFGYSATQHVDFNTQVTGTPKSDVMPATFAVTGDIAYHF